MRERVGAIRARGGLDPAQGFREYEPGERVEARLELATGSWRRGRAAGVDVMGDGSLVPYAGAIHKRRLEPGRGRDAFDAVHEAMTASVGSEP